MSVLHVFIACSASLHCLTLSVMMCCNVAMLHVLHVLRVLHVLHMSQLSHVLHVVHVLHVLQVLHVTAACVHLLNILLMAIKLVYACFSLRVYVSRMGARGLGGLKQMWYFLLFLFVFVDFS